MTRILLVEDQATAAAYLAQGLREAGLAVDVAHTGPDYVLHKMVTVMKDGEEVKISKRASMPSRCGKPPTPSM